MSKRFDGGKSGPEEDSFMVSYGQRIFKGVISVYGFETVTPWDIKALETLEL